MSGGLDAQGNRVLVPTAESPLTAAKGLETWQGPRMRIGDRRSGDTRAGNKHPEGPNADLAAHLHSHAHQDATVPYDNDHSVTNCVRQMRGSTEQSLRVTITPELLMTRLISGATHMPQKMLAWLLMLLCFPPPVLAITPGN